MIDWRMKIIVAEAERLLGLAAEDVELRGELRALAQRIFIAIDELSTGGDTGRTQATPPAAPTAEIVPESAPARPTAPGPAKAAEPLRELTLGRSPPLRNQVRTNSHSHSGTSSGSETLGEDFTGIEARCRQKAEAARWVARRRGRLEAEDGSEPEDAPSDPDLLAWAVRLTDCFYWRDPSEDLGPAEVASLEDVDGCFQVVAEALVLARVVPDKPRTMEPVLPLIAEAQSALRAALHQIQAPEDSDQLRVFEWLRTTAFRHRVYIKRFMRADDSADPTQWPDLLARIEKLGERYGQQRKKRSQHQAILNQLRAQLDLVGGGAATEDDWRKVIQAVEDLLNQGVPPSNRELRELLLPVIDELPDFPDLPPGFRRVLREIDRFLANHAPTAELSDTQEPTAAVKEASRLLGGRSIGLIGGDRRREAQESLQRALGLKELIWIETKEHQAVGGFEPIIARPDVALVLLAIRWSSHAFGDAKQLCDRYGKPLVRLPGGYNPNQVATQILAQCSAQLAQGG